MKHKIEISYKTIIFTIALIASLWFLFFVRDIIAQLYVAGIFAIILNPMVTRLEQKRVPRVLSVMIVYLSIVAALVFLVANMIPPLVEQTSNFAKAFPRYLVELNIPNQIIDQITSQFTTQLGQLPSQLISISIEIFSNLISIVAVLIFVLYFLLARRKLDDELKKYLPEKKVEKIMRLITTLEKQLGGWARAEIVLMTIIGAGTYIGLLLLGVPYALSLSLLAGILEAVPNLGPILAAIPAIIVGFGVSPITGIAVLALAFLIQQVEAYLIVPKVMQKSADVNPIVTLLSLIVGFKIYGIVGAVLAIPSAIILKVVIQDYLQHRNTHS